MHIGSAFNLNLLYTLIVLWPQGGEVAKSQRTLARLYLRIMRAKPHQRSGEPKSSNLQRPTPTPHPSYPFDSVMTSPRSIFTRLSLRLFLQRMLRVTLQFLQRVLARIRRLRVVRCLTLLVGAGGWRSLLLFAGLCIWLGALAAFVGCGHCGGGVEVCWGARSQWVGKIRAGSWFGLRSERVVSRKYRD